MVQMSVAMSGTVQMVQSCCKMPFTKAFIDVVHFWFVRSLSPCAHGTSSVLASARKVDTGDCCSISIADEAGSITFGEGNVSKTDG